MPSSRMPCSTCWWWDKEQERGGRSKQVSLCGEVARCVYVCVCVRLGAFESVQEDLELNVKFNRMPIKLLKNGGDAVKGGIFHKPACCRVLKLTLMGLLVTHGFSLKSPITINAILDRKEPQNFFKSTGSVKPLVWWILKRPS